MRMPSDPFSSHIWDIVWRVGRQFQEIRRRGCCPWFSFPSLVFAGEMWEMPVCPCFPSFSREKCGKCPSVPVFPCFPYIPWFSREKCGKCPSVPVFPRFRGRNVGNARLSLFSPVFPVFPWFSREKCGKCPSVPVFPVFPCFPCFPCFPPVFSCFLYVTISINDMGGSSATDMATVQITPEPGALVFCGSGLLVCYAALRPRRKIRSSR